MPWLSSCEIPYVLCIQLFQALLTALPLQPLGQLLNIVSRSKVLPYPEQQPDFHLPKRYAHDQNEIEAFRARHAAREKYRQAEEERARKPVRIAPVAEKRSHGRASELTLVEEGGRVIVVDEEEEDPTLVDWYGDGELRVVRLSRLRIDYSFHRRSREPAQLVRTLLPLATPLLT
jgi:hypothetical protein